MIILKPRAGLCNRMRAISSAYELSKKYNTRLIILWNRDSGLNCRFDKLFLDIPNVKVINYCLKYDFIIKLLGLFFTHKFINVRIKDRKKYEKELEKGNNILITTFSNLSEENNFKCLVIRPEIQKIIDDIISGVHNKDLVGVHIRRTDHVVSIEKSTTELFIDEMNKIIDNNPDVKFFLATDSDEEDKKLKELYGDRIISNPNKVYGRNSENGIIDGLVDLGCLSKCSCIIGSSGSSFSWTAAKWNDEKRLKYIGEE